MSDEATMPYGTPTPDWHYPREKCPHCEEHPTANRMDEHIRDAHADLPECTATFFDGGHSLYECAFRAGHKDGEHGNWHASIRGEMGRYVWNDTHKGATPYRGSEGTS